MAKTQQYGNIVSGEESELHDEPHVAGSRVTVRLIRARVEERGLTARTVADRYDLNLEDVYAALAYYHAHPDEMAQVERERERIVEESAESAVTGPEDL